MAQTIKHLPTMWETQVQSLGREDPLEKEMATHSSILAWKILWTAACQDPPSKGILQSRILEWVALPSSRRSFQPGDETQVSHITSRFLTN